MIVALVCTRTRPNNKSGCEDKGDAYKKRRQGGSDRGEGPGHKGPGQGKEGGDGEKENELITDAGTLRVVRYKEGFKVCWTKGTWALY